MKKQIDGIVVVEGKTDIALLSNYLTAEFVITNGSEISKETIDYLKHKSQNNKIYVLTDPDSPGKRIRDVLDQNINGLIHCFIKKETSIKHGKVGVAEGDIDEIIKALSQGITTDKNNNGNLTMDDLYELGYVGSCNSKMQRDRLSKELHLGFCNGKTLLKRLNYLKISKQQLQSYEE